MIASVRRSAPSADRRILSHHREVSCRLPGKRHQIERIAPLPAAVGRTQHIVATADLDPHLAPISVTRCWVLTKHNNLHRALLICASHPCRPSFSLLNYNGFIPKGTLFLYFADHLYLFTQSSPLCGCRTTRSTGCSSSACCTPSRGTASRRCSRCRRRS